MPTNITARIYLIPYLLDQIQTSFIDLGTIDSCLARFQF